MSTKKDRLFSVACKEIGDLKAHIKKLEEEVLSLRDWKEYHKSEREDLIIRYLKTLKKIRDEALKALKDGK